MSAGVGAGVSEVELVIEDAGALRRFVELVLTAPANSPKRAELEQRLVRGGEATLAEIGVFGRYFKLALEQRRVTQREYDVLVKWLKTATDKLVRPALSVEKLMNQRTLKGGIIRS